MDEVGPDIKLKFLVLGDSGAGKTSLWARYVGGIFSETPVQSDGNSQKKTITAGDKSVELEFLDMTAVQRGAQGNGLYRGIHGVVIVFDVTDQTSFNNVKQWHQEVQRYAREGIPVVIVGTKTDLVEQRVVDFNTVKDFADQLDIPYVEASSQNGTNVDEVFATLTREAVPNLSSADIQEVFDLGKAVNVINHDAKLSYVERLVALKKLHAEHAFEINQDFIKSFSEGQNLGELEGKLSSVLQKIDQILTNPEEPSVYERLMNLKKWLYFNDETKPFRPELKQLIAIKLSTLPPEFFSSIPDAQIKGGNDNLFDFYEPLDVPSTAMQAVLDQRQEERKEAAIGALKEKVADKKEQPMVALLREVYVLCDQLRGNYDLIKNKEVVKALVEQGYENIGSRILSEARNEENPVKELFDLQRAKQLCAFLGLEPEVHNSFEERMVALKDTIQGYDDDKVKAEVEKFSDASSDVDPLIRLNHLNMLISLAYKDKSVPAAIQSLYQEKARELIHALAERYVTHAQKLQADLNVNEFNSPEHEFKTDDTPTIKAMIDYANGVASVFSEFVLGNENPDFAVLAIKQLLAIANECQKQGDYLSASSIFSALTQGGVKRLFQRSEGGGTLTVFTGVLSAQEQDVYRALEFLFSKAARRYVAPLMAQNENPFIEALGPYSAEIVQGTGASGKDFDAQNEIIARTIPIFAAKKEKAKARLEGKDVSGAAVDASKLFTENDLGVVSRAIMPESELPRSVKATVDFVSENEANALVKMAQPLRARELVERKNKVLALDRLQPLSPKGSRLVSHLAKSGAENIKRRLNEIKSLLGQEQLSQKEVEKLGVLLPELISVMEQKLARLQDRMQSIISEEKQNSSEEMNKMKKDIDVLSEDIVYLREFAKNLQLDINVPQIKGMKELVEEDKATDQPPVQSPVQSTTSIFGRLMNAVTSIFRPQAEPVIQMEELPPSINDTESDLLEDEKRPGTQPEPENAAESELAQENAAEVLPGSGITWGQYWEICDRYFEQSQSDVDISDAQKSVNAHQATCQDLGIAIEDLHILDAAVVEKTEAEGQEFDVGAYKKNFEEAVAGKISKEIIPGVSWGAYWKKFESLRGKGKSEESTENSPLHLDVCDALKIHIPNLETIAALPKDEFEQRVNEMAARGEVKGPTTLETERQQPEPRLVEVQPVPKPTALSPEQDELRRLNTSFYDAFINIAEKVDEFVNAHPEDGELKVFGEHYAELLAFYKEIKAVEETDPINRADYVAQKLFANDGEMAKKIIQFTEEKKAISGRYSEQFLANSQDARDFDNALILPYQWILKQKIMLEAVLKSGHPEVEPIIASFKQVADITYKPALSTRQTVEFKSLKEGKGRSKIPSAELNEQAGEIQNTLDKFDSLGNVAKTKALKGIYELLERYVGKLENRAGQVLKNEKEKDNVRHLLENISILLGFLKEKDAANFGVKKAEIPLAKIIGSLSSISGEKELQELASKVLLQFEGISAEIIVSQNKGTLRNLTEETIPPLSSLPLGRAALLRSEPGFDMSKLREEAPPLRKAKTAVVGATPASNNAAVRLHYAVFRIPFKNETLKAALLAKILALKADHTFPEIKDDQWAALENFITSRVAQFSGAASFGNYQAMVANPGSGLSKATKALFALTREEFYPAVGRMKPLPEPKAEEARVVQSSGNMTAAEIDQVLRAIVNDDLKALLKSAHASITPAVSRSLGEAFAEHVKALNDRFALVTPSYDEYAEFLGNIKEPGLRHVFELSKGVFDGLVELHDIESEEREQIAASSELLSAADEIRRLFQEYKPTLEKFSESGESVDAFNKMQKDAFDVLLKDLEPVLLQIRMGEANAKGIIKSLETIGQQFFEASGEFSLEGLSNILKSLEDKANGILRTYEAARVLGPFIGELEAPENQAVAEMLWSQKLDTVAQVFMLGKTEGNLEEGFSDDAKQTIALAFAKLRDDARKARQPEAIELSASADNLMVAEESEMQVVAEETGKKESVPLLSRVATRLGAARVARDEARQQKAYSKTPLGQLSALAQKEELSKKDIVKINQLLNAMKNEIPAERVKRADPLYYPVEMMKEIVTVLAKHYQTPGLDIAAIQGMFPPSEEVRAYLEAEAKKLDQLIDSLDEETFSDIFEDYFKPDEAVYKTFYVQMDAARNQEAGTYEQAVNSYTFRDILKKSFDIGSQAQGGQAGIVRDKPACDAAEAFLRATNGSEVVEVQLIRSILEARSALSVVDRFDAARNGLRAEGIDLHTVDFAVNAIGIPKDMVEEYHTKSANLAKTRTAYLAQESIQNEPLADALSSVIQAEEKYFGEDAYELDDLSDAFIVRANALVGKDATMPDAFLENCMEFKNLIEGEIVTGDAQLNARTALIIAVVKGNIDYELNPERFEAIDANLMNAKRYQAELANAIKVVQRKFAGSALIEIEALRKEKAIVDKHVEQLSGQLNEVQKGRKASYEAEAAELQGKADAAEASMLVAAEDLEEGVDKKWVPAKLRKKSAAKEEVSSNEQLLQGVNNEILRNAMAFELDRKEVKLAGMESVVLAAAIQKINEIIPPGENVMPDQFLKKYAEFLDAVKDIPGINDIRAEFIIAVIAQNKTPIEQQDFETQLEEAGDDYTQLNGLYVDIDEANKEVSTYLQHVIQAESVLKVHGAEEDVLQGLGEEIERLSEISLGYLSQLNVLAIKQERKALGTKLAAANDPESLRQLSAEIKDQMDDAKAALDKIGSRLDTLGKEEGVGAEYDRDRLIADLKRWESISALYQEMNGAVERKISAAAILTETVTKQPAAKKSTAPQASLVIKPKAAPAKPADKEKFEPAVVVYHPDEIDVNKRFEKVSGNATQMKAALESDNHVINIKSDSVSYTQPEGAQKLSSQQMKELVQKMVEETYKQFKPAKASDIQYEGTKELQTMAKDMMKKEIRKHAPVEEAKVAPKVKDPGSPAERSPRGSPRGSNK